MFSRGSGDKNPEVDLQKAKQMPEILCVAISILGGAVCWWLDCVVTAREDIHLVMNPNLDLSKLIYVEIMSSDLKDYKVCVMVSLAPYQSSCEILLAVDEGI